MPVLHPQIFCIGDRFSVSHQRNLSFEEHEMKFEALNFTPPAITRIVSIRVLCASASSWRVDVVIRQHNDVATVRALLFPPTITPR